MDLNIATINIRGFGSPSKKRYLSDFLNEHSIDIACFQKISNPFHDFQDKNYNYILNYGTSALGIAVIIKNHLKPLNIEKDPNGRIIKIIFNNF